MKSSALHGALGVVAVASMVCSGCGCGVHQRDIVRHLEEVQMEYVEDGAADGTIVEEAPELRARNRSDIGNLLRHLDDIRPSRAVAHSDGAIARVPIAYLCLDVLMMSVERDCEAFVESNDDGWGSNVNPEYYFPPNVLATENGRSNMRAVQRRWKRLDENGQLRVRRDASGIGEVFEQGLDQDR